MNVSVGRSSEIRPGVSACSRRAVFTLDFFSKGLFTRLHNESCWPEMILSHFFMDCEAVNVFKVITTGPV